MPKNDSDLTEEDNKLDEQQFKKLLYKIFPNTKNLKGKIKEMDMIEKKMNHADLNNTNETAGDEESESDSDSDSEFTDEEELLQQPVNIIVTMGNLDQLDDY